MKKLFLAAFAGACLMQATVAEAKKNEPELSGLELQQVQSNDFEAPKDMVFGSVMSVVQDAGYRVQSADLATGLITAISSTKGKLTYSLWTGFGKSKKSPMVSVFIEAISPTVTRVRMNFVEAKIKSTIYGSQPQDEEPILDPAIYREAFEKVSQAIFLRQSMAAAPQTTPAPTMPVPNAEPIATIQPATATTTTK